MLHIKPTVYQPYRPYPIWFGCIWTSFQFSIYWKNGFEQRVGQVGILFCHRLFDHIGICTRCLPLIEGGGIHLSIKVKSLFYNWRMCGNIYSYVGCCSNYFWASAVSSRSLSISSYWRVIFARIIIMTPSYESVPNLLYLFFWGLWCGV